MPKFEFDVDHIGQVSDKYHTFDELYYHRRMLFLFICKQNRGLSWKSWKHDDGDMFDDMFIAGIKTPEGHYTYHFDKEHWDSFDVKELDNAPTYDGHQPKDVTRLFSLIK